MPELGGQVGRRHDPDADLGRQGNAQREVQDCFFFNDTATTEIYTLSLHDALPISRAGLRGGHRRQSFGAPERKPHSGEDRKSTRLNSSHSQISYAVFCLKKKNTPAVLVVLVSRRLQPVYRSRLTSSVTT